MRTDPVQSGIRRAVRSDEPACADHGSIASHAAHIRRDAGAFAAKRIAADDVGYRPAGRRYAFEAVFPSPGVCVLEGGHFRTESAPNGVGADARRASRYRRCSDSGECTAREAFEADRGKPSVRHDGNPDLRADRHAAGTSGRIKKHRRSGSGQTSAWTDHHHRNLCQAQKQPDLCRHAARFDLPAGAAAVSQRIRREPQPVRRGLQGARQRRWPALL